MGYEQTITAEEVLACAGLGLSDAEAVMLLRGMFGVEAIPPFGSPLSDEQISALRARVLAAREDWKVTERLTREPAEERRAIPACMAAWPRHPAAERRP